MTEKRGDRVFTPDWVAKDMVTHFRPAGSVLEPCRGDGVFMQYLPTAEWCEIDEGKDFFEWTKPVDWVIGNPPYSITRKWFRRSYTIATQIVYLVPLRNIFSGYGFLKEIHEYGGTVEIRIYGTGGHLNFPMGNAVGAIHLRRSYRESTMVTFF